MIINHSGKVMVVQRVSPSTHEKLSLDQGTAIMAPHFSKHRLEVINMIVIYGIKEQLDPIKGKLSDILHECMQSVLGLPEDKRAHRFVALGKDDFYYPEGRSNAYTVIEINMMAGRKPETQKALIKTIFQELESQLSLQPIDVEITIQEQQPYQWGFRGLTGDDALDLKYKIKV